MRSVHVEGARNIAEAARASGAAALVHVSAIGADRASPSNYGRTKAEGEAAVRKAFPAATIVRPSLVFGPEDNLTNRFARMAQLPVLPVIAGNRKFQPVYVRDLARAIALAALEPKRFAGQAYEIGGPQAMTMTELQQVIHGITGQDPLIVQLPDAAASILSWLGVVPGAPLTRDQWMMLQRDNLPAGGAPGLEAFGIAPTPLAAVGEEWLGRFRRGGKFGARRNNLTATS
jgi:NADH dehydrogenase